MTIKDFIERAVEGGWSQTSVQNDCTKLLFLDPLAWQAVGKVEGWGRYFCPECKMSGYVMSAGRPYCMGCGHDLGPILEWHHNMHRMIDALAEGKTIEDFLSTL